MAKQLQISSASGSGKGCVGCGSRLPTGPFDIYINGGCLGTQGGGNLESVTKEQILDTEFTYAYLNGNGSNPNPDITDVAAWEELVYDLGTLHGPYHPTDPRPSLCADEGNHEGGGPWRFYINDALLMEFTYHDMKRGMSFVPAFAIKKRIRDLPNAEAVVDSIIQRGLKPSCSCAGDCGQAGGREFTLNVKVVGTPNWFTGKGLAGAIRVKMGSKLFVDCVSAFTRTASQNNTVSGVLNPFKQGYCVCGLGNIRRYPYADQAILL
jgi:hypothetical protein